MIYILKMIHWEFIKLSLADGLKGASSSGALSTFFSAIVHKPSSTFDCLHFDDTQWLVWNRNHKHLQCFEKRWNRDCLEKCIFSLKKKKRQTCVKKCFFDSNRCDAVWKRNSYKKWRKSRIFFPIQA